MKIRTSELKDQALDWAVAYADGLVDLGGKLNINGGYTPSTNWSQGGPILQNHISELIDCGEGGWEACCNGTYGATGSTALEAVCLAYCASKLGDEVEVPDGLN